MLLLSTLPNLPGITPDLSEYERETLQFCQEWLSGREEFVRHTSGSTGQPKPVALSRRQMRASAQATAQALDLRSGDHALVCLPPRYIAGTMMLVRGLEVGMKMTVVEPAGNPLQSIAAGTHFDFTALVPRQLQTILAETPDKRPVLHGMKAILVGGAAVSRALEEEIQQIGAPVYGTYGMTETVSHVALRRLNGPARSDAYTALPGVRIGLDERGCLWIQAPSTDGQTVQTNDQAELTGPGAFRWLGRVDHVINSGGIKIQPAEIERYLEEVLTELRLSLRCFAFGLPHPAWGEMLCVAVESPPLSPPQEKRVKERLTQRAGRYQTPKHFLYLPQFPETPTGKVDRKKAIALLAQQISV
ncbi:MAG: AMP-binding protein [Ferruginibacter sp.]|nr:AMP-binding protein [Cytophagales bacterium]